MGVAENLFEVTQAEKFMDEVYLSKFSDVLIHFLTGDPMKHFVSFNKITDLFRFEHC